MKRKIRVGLIAIVAIVVVVMFAANAGGKVWSDGYVELTLNKMERTDKQIKEIQEVTLYPNEGHDFIIVHLMFTRIEGRHVLSQRLPENFLLFDVRGDKYTIAAYELLWSSSMLESVERNVGMSHPQAMAEGSELILIFEMPKDREPALLRYTYNFTESWENVSYKEGDIEIDLPATKGVPGFEIIFVIAGLLVITYLLRRKKE